MLGKPCIDLQTHLSEKRSGQFVKLACSPETVVPSHRQQVYAQLGVWSTGILLIKEGSDESPVSAAGLATDLIVSHARCIPEPRLSISGAGRRFMRLA